jgi:hypothetical protein
VGRYQAEGSPSPLSVSSFLISFPLTKPTAPALPLITSVPPSIPKLQSIPARLL